MRKKTIRTFVSLLLILTLAGTTAYAESATVLGDAVNLRAGPGVKYRVLDTIPGGAVVEVTDTSNVAWYGVSYAGKSGYMSTGYLRVNYGSDSATVSYAEPFYAASSAEEGTAVIILEGASPTAQSASTPAPVTVELPAATPAPTATPAPSVAPAATYTPASSAPAADAEAEAGTAVIILGDNTIYLPAAQTAQPAETSTPAPAADTSRVGKTAYINGDFVCFRSAASGTASILNTYNKGKELVITGAATGDWTPVRIDGAEGFVSTRYITLGEEYLASMSSGAASAPVSSSTPAPAPTQTQTPTGSVSSGNAYIAGNNVRFRSGPSMSSAIIGEFFYGNSVTVTGSTGDWTAVSYNGKSGYVYSRYVKTGSFQTSTATPSGGAVSSGSVTGQQIVDYALQFVGYRYVWGGASPETGFDCSGFTQYVYKHFGYQLNRVACDQAKNGVHVEKDALQPGDVLCFYSSADYIGHVGIYIGNNRFVHASTSTTGVIISELNGYYWTRGYEARRIV